MKYILTLLCLSFLTAYGQEPAYTPMRLAYKFGSAKVDSLFLVPSFVDTNAANLSTMKNVAGALIRCGNDFYMRNTTTNCWLQNVNVGTGANPNIQYVDSIYRIAGKDSIFWRKAGVVNKIKDSSGLPDSPDRIDGTATNGVVADMNNFQFELQNASQFSFIDTSGASIATEAKKINIEHDTVVITSRFYPTLKISKNEFIIKDFNSTLFTTDTIGNSTLGIDDKAQINVKRNDTIIKFFSSKPMTWRQKASSFVSQVQTAYNDNNIDLTSANYEIKLPGVYTVVTDNTNDVIFPDPALFPGQSITIINRTGLTINLNATSGTIYDGKSNSLTTVADGYVYTFYSNGIDYYANNTY